MVRNHFTSSIFTAAAILGAFSLVSMPASAQDKQGKNATAKAAPSKPTPRMPDGHPDLGNGKGIWDVRIIDDMTGTGGGEKDAKTREAQKKMVDKPVDVAFTPEAKKVYEYRQGTLSKDDPEGYCLPPGIPRMMNTPFPMQIYQLPDRIMQVFEGGAHMWRVIYMDGRKHTPADKWNPTYLGESIGHWEGDTLVVDVVGFNDRTWLDAAGHPHGEKLHVVERYTRDDEDTLHYQATIEDPDFYTKPWSVGWHIKWKAGWEPYEYVCQENNKDVVIEHHLVGLRPGEAHP
jgi:hypothetical protein